MRNRISVTVPTSHTHDFALKALITAAIIVAGGATVTEASGTWYDDEAREYKEHVTIYHMWYKEQDQASMLAAVRKVIDKLHSLGEIAVLVEALTATSEGQETSVHILEVGDPLTLI